MGGRASPGPRCYHRRHTATTVAPYRRPTATLPLTPFTSRPARLSEKDREHTRSAISDLIADRDHITVSPSPELLELNQLLQGLTKSLRESLGSIAAQAHGRGDSSMGEVGGGQALDEARVATVATRLEACAAATVSLQHAVLHMEKSLRETAATGAEAAAADQVTRTVAVAAVGVAVGVILGAWRFSAG